MSEDERQNTRRLEEAQARADKRVYRLERIATGQNGNGKS
jgi:hypothetical protein